MKKLLVFVSVLVLLVSFLAVPVSATTKNDLLEEAAKSPVYHYVKVAVENAARTIEITDEQAAELLPIVQKAVAAVPEDHGATEGNGGASYYTKEQFDTVMACIDEACEILDLTYAFEPTGSSDPNNSVIFKVYDKDQKLIFEYDGDTVKKTSAAAEVDTRVIFVAAAAVLVVGVVALVVAKKRASVR